MQRLTDFGWFTSLMVLKTGEYAKETFDRKITVIPTDYLLKDHKGIDRDNGGELRPSALHFSSILSRERKHSWTVHRPQSMIVGGVLENCPRKGFNLSKSGWILDNSPSTIITLLAER